MMTDDNDHQPAQDAGTDPLDEGLTTESSCRFLDSDTMAVVFAIFEIANHDPSFFWELHDSQCDCGGNLTSLELQFE